MIFNIIYNLKYYLKDYFKRFLNMEIICITFFIKILLTNQEKYLINIESYFGLGKFVKVKRSKIFYKGKITSGKKFIFIKNYDLF